MERVWLRRLQWRWRGAWQWPAFIALTLGDAVLLHLLPIGGGGHTGLYGALLLAMFFNLVAVAAVGPLIGLALRRRSPSLPKVIASDRGGTIALAATTLILAGFGIAHRDDIRAQREGFVAQSYAARVYVAHEAAAEYRRNIARADSVQLGEQLYRTCVPGDEPHRPLCLIIDLSSSPPGVKRDTSSAANTTFVPYAQP
jgi:hypothetical protein